MRKIGTIEKMTPGSAIRAFCVSCCGGVFGEVKSCDGDGTDPAYHACPFHPYRLGRGRSSIRVFRKFCLQCMGGRADFVRECDDSGCFCYPFRMGRNPAHSNRKVSAHSIEALQRCHKGARESGFDGQILTISP